MRKILKILAHAVATIFSGQVRSLKKKKNNNSLNYQHHHIISFIKRTLIIWVKRQNFLGKYAVLTFLKPQIRQNVTGDQHRSNEDAGASDPGRVAQHSEIHLCFPMSKPSPHSWNAVPALSTPFPPGCTSSISLFGPISNTTSPKTFPVPSSIPLSLLPPFF